MTLMRLIGERSYLVSKDLSLGIIFAFSLVFMAYHLNAAYTPHLSPLQGGWERPLIFNLTFLIQLCTHCVVWAILELYFGRLGLISTVLFVASLLGFPLWELRSSITRYSRIKSSALPSRRHHSVPNISGREHHSPKRGIFCWIVITPLKNRLGTPIRSLQYIIVLIPKFAAAEDDAPRNEWALNTDVSIPATSSRDLSHLAMVL